MHEPYLDLWRRLGGIEVAPSSYDLSTGAGSDYQPEAGIVMVRRVASGSIPRLDEVDISEEGYYSASLVLFSVLAGHPALTAG